MANIGVFNGRYIEIIKEISDMADKLFSLDKAFSGNYQLKTCIAIQTEGENTILTKFVD